jgi:hypothetical protein
MQLPLLNQRRLFRALFNLIESGCTIFRRAFGPDALKKLPGRLVVGVTGYELAGEGLEKNRLTKDVNISKVIHYNFFHFINYG